MLSLLRWNTIIFLMEDPFKKDVFWSHLLNPGTIYPHCLMKLSLGITSTTDDFSCFAVTWSDPEIWIHRSAVWVWHEFRVNLATMMWQYLQPSCSTSTGRLCPLGSWLEQSWRPRPGSSHHNGLRHGSDWSLYLQSRESRSCRSPPSSGRREHRVYPR